jgi:hypothetical protein
LCLHNQIVGIFCMVFSFQHTLQFRVSEENSYPDGAWN